jgi:hypothetical protein
MVGPKCLSEWTLDDETRASQRIVTCPVLQRIVGKVSKEAVRSCTKVFVELLRRLSEMRKTMLKRDGMPEVLRGLEAKVRIGPSQLQSPSPSTFCIILSDGFSSQVMLRRNIPTCPHFC